MVSCREAIQRVARRHGFEATLDLHTMATSASLGEVQKFVRSRPEVIFKELKTHKTKLQETMEQVDLDFKDILALLFHLEDDSKTFEEKMAKWASDHGGFLKMIQALGTTWEFPKIRGTFFKVPMVRIVIFLGSILGFPILRNCHLVGH